MSLVRSLRPASALISRSRMLLSALPTTNTATRSFAAEVTPKQEVPEWMVGREQTDKLGGFEDQPALGPFGTMDQPIRIYSAFRSRIVGCKGGVDNGVDVKHRLFWFELKEGKKHVCQECGQVFQLVTENTAVNTAAKHA